METLRTRLERRDGAFVLDLKPLAVRQHGFEVAHFGCCRCYTCRQLLRLALVLGLSHAQLRLHELQLLGL